VERRPSLAPEAVIFGVDFTGPDILVVNDVTRQSIQHHLVSEQMIKVSVNARLRVVHVQ
jgi:hypothetical protein